MKLRKIIPILSLAFALVLSGCTATSQPKTTDSTAIEMTKVEVDAGTLVGYHEDNLYIFRGIPYATAERFQSPVAVTSYEGGTKLALSYGTVSPQDRGLNGTGAINANEFMTPSNGTADMVMNENCQNLNVWTKDLTGNKPVLVFFHGGGLSNGASSELSYYTGEYFADREDVVFVSVNHRLNYLGYLDLSAYGGEEYANSGLVGLEDCVVALEWVQKNIAKFGGDPENVTILGQSGGGTKVTTLACMSNTADLFDRVFMMSGGYTGVNGNKQAAEANAQKLVDYLGLSKDEVIPTLTAMDYEDLYEACTAAKVSASANYGISTFESPMFDAEGNMNEYAAARTWIVGTTYSEFSDNGNGMIYGQNPDNILDDITEEETLTRLQERYGDKAQSIIDEYKEAYPTHAVCEALFLNGMPSGGLARWGIINPDNGILDLMNDNDVTVYNYVVAYRMPYFGGLTMHHTGDIPYWFYSIEEVDYQIKGDETNAYKVSGAMADALAHFVTDGNPSTDALEWKAYTAEEHNTMVFDTTSELKVDFDTELYKLMMGQ